MSATNVPFGMRPAFHPSGLDRAKAYTNGLASGFATGILKFQPVCINPTGRVINTVAASGADYIGVFAGVEYVDSFGKPTFSNQWIANTTLLSGAPITVWVWDDPNIIYEIQADGSVAQNVGNQVDFSNVTAGSTTTGISACTASATQKGTGVQGMLRIIDKGRQVDNDWGDAFTILQVQIARHQYTSNKTAV